MAETLAKTLSADYIVVGELCPNNKVIRAPAIWREDDSDNREIK